MISNHHIEFIKCHKCQKRQNCHLANNKEEKNKLSCTRIRIHIIRCRILTVESLAKKCKEDNKID